MSEKSECKFYLEWNLIGNVRRVVGLTLYSWYLYLPQIYELKRFTPFTPIFRSETRLRQREQSRSLPEDDEIVDVLITVYV